MAKKYRIGIHVLLWGLILLNDFLPKYLSDDHRSYTNIPPPGGFFFNYLLVCIGYLISNVFVFYFTSWQIAPALFIKRQWLKGMIFTMLLALFIPAYRYIIEYHFFLPYLDFDNYYGGTPDISWYIKNSILYTFYSYVIYGLVYFMIEDWYLTNRKKKELEKDKIASELAFLKSQINPHFLFNTLNDIYALTYRKSELAPNAVLKLSELLRYMLKESDGTFADLQKEVDYLKNVIELHQIGQKGLAFINFEIEGVLEGQRIAPLILINFVENAFKHGVIDNPLSPITIKLVISKVELIFEVSNLKNQDHKDNTGGIGLMNVKRRLDLIYPGSHLLQIEEKENKFNVSLKIEWV